MRATPLYRAIMNKSAGDHGGHIIGHTRSGKPIYASHHNKNASVVAAGRKGDGPVASNHALSAHVNYSAADHLDAADAHAVEAARIDNKEHREGSHIMAQAHAASSMAARARDKKLSPS